MSRARSEIPTRLQRCRMRTTSPSALVVLGIASVQFGAAIASTLFDDVGVGGVVMIRIVLAAILLVLLWRPTIGGHTRNDLWLVGAFGFVLAAMNLTFYESINR